MAPRTILAQLVVALKDDASKGAKNLSGNLKDLEKSAVNFAKTMQGAKWGSAFTRDLGKLKATQTEIDAIKKSWSQLQAELGSTRNAKMRTDAARAWANDWRNQLAAVRIAQQQNVEQTIADSKRQAAEQKKAAAQAAKDQLRVARETAKEKARLAREASQAERQAAQESARAAREAAREQARTARQAAREARVAAREAARAEREHGRGAGAMGRAVFRNVAHAAGITGGAYLGGRATRFSVTAGAEAQREAFRQRVAGMTPEERLRVAADSERLSTLYPSVSKVQIAETARGARNLTGSTAAGLDLLPDLIRARVALQSAYGDDGNGQLDSILKAADIAGLQDNPDRFRRFLDSYIKASQVEGKQISGGDYLSYYRRAKMAGAGLNDEFLATTAPTMMQESGGPTAGTMLSTAYQQMIGNRITKKAAAAQRAAGLRGKDGKLVDRELYIQDPFAWNEKYLVPALQRQGVDINDPVQTSNAMSPLFSERNAAEFHAKMTNQREQIIRNKGLYAGAAGLKAGDDAGKEDPFVASQGLSGALTNLTSALTGPAMPAAAQMLNGLAGGINSLATSLTRNPDIAKIAGIGLAGGVGVVGAGAAIGAAKGLLPGGSGLIGGGLIGAGQTLPMMARFAGPIGAAYLGYQAGSAIGGGINAIGSVAAGTNYTPGDAEGVFNLADRLGAIEREMAGIRDRTHPSRAGEPNADLSRLEAEAQDLRNRIAAGTAGAGGEVVRQLADEISAGRATVEAAMEAVMEAARARARSGITVPLNVAPGGGGSNGGAAPARASGGSVSAGGLYRVNEYGEEFFQPMEDGRIIDPRRKAAGDGGGRTVASISISPTFNITGGADARETARETLAELETTFRETMRTAFSDYGVDVA